MGFKLFAFWNSIWYMSWYMIFLKFQFIYDLVYIWYMIGLQKWPKNFTLSESFWSDFTYFGISLVVPPLCLIPKATRNDYFWLVSNWYIAWWYTYDNLFLLWLVPCWEFYYDISWTNIFGSVAILGIIPIWYACAMMGNPL